MDVPSPHPPATSPSTDSLDDPCVRGCIEALHRCEIVVQTLASAKRASVIERVGPHLRHIIDHFTCLLDGYARGGVDYDRRAREPRLERDVAVMATALHELHCQLLRLASTDISQPLTVRQRVCSDTEANLASSLERELAFLSAHTVHHLSIVAQVLRAAGIEIDPRLELAFSTAAYLERRAAPPTT